MNKTRFQECGNCVHRTACSGQCIRTPQNAIWGKQTSRLNRIWQGRMLTQKILDIEEALPPYQKQVAQLYYRQGLTQQQIADIIGVTQGSISRALSRVHARIHRMYHKQLQRMHARIQHAATGRSTKRIER